METGRPFDQARPIEGSCFWSKVSSATRWPDAPDPQVGQYVDTAVGDYSLSDTSIRPQWSLSHVRMTSGPAASRSGPRRMLREPISR
jgi:hypothetical protein